MGRGPEMLGDLRTRLVMDAIDAPVVAPLDTRLHEHLAQRYDCDEDYCRQVVNELENSGVIYVERDGQIPVAYDIHPAHLRRTDSGWTPTELLAALRKPPAPPAPSPASATTRSRLADGGRASSSQPRSARGTPRCRPPAFTRRTPAGCSTSITRCKGGSAAP